MKLNKQELGDLMSLLYTAIEYEETFLKAILGCNSASDNHARTKTVQHIKKARKLINKFKTEINKPA